MRERKYRAWHGKTRIMLSHEMIMKMILGSSILLKTFDESKIIRGNPFQHDELIMMDYIGFKDKKKKEIFEGDVLGTSVNHSGKIIYEKIIIQYGFEAGNDYDQTAIGYERPSAKHFIIGNIYEDPELLKSELFKC